MKTGTKAGRDKMEFGDGFWKYINKLVADSEIIIDRPKGTRHPKYNDMIYEFDYGYIKDTKTADGGGLDVFKGSLHSKNVHTIICTVDLLKKDIEIKLLIGCTTLEKKKIYGFLNDSEYMKAIMTEKDIPVENMRKEIIPVKKDCDFDEIYEVFEDVVWNPDRENIKNILTGYEQDSEKTLYGCFLDGKLAGIIGIKRNTESTEILHFGVHPEYREKRLGTELMDYIRKEKKTMVLTTDDDAVIFYEKYGFECTECHEENHGRRRYECIYRQ